MKFYTQFLFLRILLLFTSIADLTACSSALYQPTSELYYPPQNFHLKPEVVRIPVANSETIYGWYFHAKPTTSTKGTVVFFHGNGENISSHYLSLAWLLWNGYDFFIFDYRGYGQSSGDPSQENTVGDGKAALRWVYGRNPHLPIAVFAQSLGSAIAMKTMIELKNEIPIRLVVIDSGFLSYRSAAKSVLASHWMTWPLQPAASWAICDSGAPGDQISKISSTSWPTPWVIIHGDQDRVIDISLGEEVYQKAPDPKEFWRIHQGGHTDALWRTDDQNVRARLLSKLDSIFCLAPCRPRPLQYEPWMVRRLPNTQPPVWPDE